MSLGLSIFDYVRLAPETVDVAKGVDLFRSRPYGEVGRDAVLVFDSNGTPGASAAVLADSEAHR